MRRVMAFVSLLLLGAAAADAVECEPLAKLWTSDEYAAARVTNDGEMLNPWLEGITAQLIVVHQEGCAFEGINQWNKPGVIGEPEPVAGVIKPPQKEGDPMVITMVEVVSEPRDGGSAGRIDATVEDGIMRWHYLGFGSRAPSEHWVTAFDANFIAGETGPGLDIDCADFSGVWYSDPFDYLKLFKDGSHEIRGPTTNVLNLTQDGCRIVGTNSWQSGPHSGFEYVAGVAHSDAGGTATLGEVVTNANDDGRIDAVLRGDGVIAFHFVSHGDDDSASVFDAFFGKNAAPGLPPPTCASTDLVGTYETGPYDIYTIVGGENWTVTPFAGRPLEITNQEGCIFWGQDVSTTIGGVVHEDGALNTATATEVGAHDELYTIAEIQYELVGPDEFIFHYVGLSVDKSYAVIFDGESYKTDATATPTAGDATDAPTPAGDATDAPTPVETNQPTAEPTKKKSDGASRVGASLLLAALVATAAA